MTCHSFLLIGVCASSETDDLLCAWCKLGQNQIISLFSQAYHLYSPFLKAAARPIIYTRGWGFIFFSLTTNSKYLLLNIFFCSLLFWLRKTIYSEPFLKVQGLMDTKINCSLLICDHFICSSREPSIILI